MKHIALVLGLLLAFSQAAIAQDLSLSPLVPKPPILTSSRCNLSLPVNISTATTTLLVDGSANTLPLHICRFVSSVVGTSPTLKFIYGTKASTDCDTAPTPLSGVFVVATGTIFTLPVQVDSIASKELCIVSGGTTPSVQGVFEYGYWL